MSCNESQTLLQFHIKKSYPRILSAKRLLATSWDTEKATSAMIFKARKQIQCFSIKCFIYSICFKKIFQMTKELKPESCLSISPDAGLARVSGSSLTRLQLLLCLILSADSSAPRHVEPGHRRGAVHGPVAGVPHFCGS